MNRHMKRALIVLVFALCIAARSNGFQQAAGIMRPQTACADLAKLSWPDTTISSAEEIAAGEYTPAGGRPLTNLPAFCRVALTVAPQIRIEAWIPRATWTGRSVGEGGGGSAAQFSSAALAARTRGGSPPATTAPAHPGSAAGQF